MKRDGLRELQKKAKEKGGAENFPRIFIKMADTVCYAELKETLKNAYLFM